MNSRNDKDPASVQNWFCFSAEELVQFRNNKIVDPQKRIKIKNHLFAEKCKRCLELYHHSLDEDLVVDFLTGEVAEKDKQKIQKLEIIEPQKLEKGQIWTSSCDVKNRRGEIIQTVAIGIPVCIYDSGTGQKDNNNIIHIFPLSFDTQYHLDGHDVIINSPSQTKFPLLVEIFNEKNMSAENLSDYRGNVSENDFLKIQAVRRQYLNGKAKRPNKKIAEWQKREVRLTEYLAIPVNNKRSDDPEIVLKPYKRAAKDSGPGLSEIIPHNLIETEEYAVGIIQNKDQIVLRFVSDSMKPLKIMANNKSMEIPSSTKGQYEVLLGYVDHIPESVEIKIQLQNHDLTLRPKFHKKVE